MVRAARQNGVLIAATLFTLVPGRSGEPIISPHLKSLRPFLKKGDFAPGAWGQQLVDELAEGVDIAVAAHLPLLYMRARESELAVKSAAALSAFDPSRAPLVDRFVSDVGNRHRANWVAKSSLLPCATARNSRSRDSTAFSACGVFRRKL